MSQSCFLINLFKLFNTSLFFDWILSICFLITILKLDLSLWIHIIFLILVFEVFNKLVINNFSLFLYLSELCSSLCGRFATPWFRRSMCALLTNDSKFLGVTFWGLDFNKGRIWGLTVIFLYFLYGKSFLFCITCCLIESERHLSRSLYYKIFTKLVLIIFYISNSTSTFPWVDYSECLCVEQKYWALM